VISLIRMRFKGNCLLAKQDRWKK